MALFSRRTIQAMVQDISNQINRRQLRDLVRRLNLTNSQSIDAEYELAVILGISRLGQISHEPDLGGSSRIDILFNSECGSVNEFIADVTCISHQGLSDRAPRDFLFAEFERLLEMHGVGIAGFHFQIAHIETGSSYDDRKVTLKIPGNRETTRILNAEIPAIAEAILQESDRCHEFNICRDGLEVEITYEPGRWGYGGGHRVVDLPLSLTHNPVYEALDSKAIQLNNAGYSGTKGIFLCDSGCRILQNEYHVESYSLERILEEFFRSHGGIDFVCTLYFSQYQRQERDSSERRSTYRLVGGISYNPNATHPISDALKVLISRLPDEVPDAECDGYNAQRWVSAQPRPYGRSFFGGCSMDGMSVKLPARALQELLAGRLDQETFLKGHGFLPDEFKSGATNPFETALADGRLIAHIELNTIPTADDDWVTIRFGEPNAAISPIAVPRKPK